MYSGLIIKESITNEQILDKLDVVSVELWKTDNKPKYWTAISFTSNYEDFPKHLSNALALSSESGLVGIIFDRVTFSSLGTSLPVIKSE